MSPEISERSFEDAIECALLEYGPDACAGADNVFSRSVAAVWQYSAGWIQ
jgi:hypothetical protein